MALISLLFSLNAWAYIPEYSTITSRAADHHGKGYYQIEQDVTYRKDADLHTVRETWVVGGENTLRVQLEGRGSLKGLVQGAIVFDAGSKRFTDTSPRTQRLTDQWLEPLFHFRSSKWLRQRLVNLKVVPAESLKDRPPMNFEGDPVYQPLPYVRLSRVGGGIAWAIGQAPEGPTLWLEQDQFTVRKFRASDQSVVRADDYAKFDETFWFPRNRTFVFGPHTVQVQTVSVRPLGPKWTPPPPDLQRDALRLPEPEGLREFYLRFR